MLILRSKRPVAKAMLAAAVILVSADAALSAENDAERVFREARGYTVRIRTLISTPFISDTKGSFEGAGFLVDAGRGWIITNAHVVGRSPSEVEVAFADEPFQPAEKVYVDGFADVAVLAVRGVAKGRKAAVLNCGAAVSIGEPVGAFGHPLGMYFTATRGIVSGKTDQCGPDLLQIDATVDHGNSGGPTIALRDGRVVGITTAGADGDKSDRVNFATPMRDVGRILDLLRRGITPSPPYVQVALLRDETGSHTLEVAKSFDGERWPLEPGDVIRGIDGEASEFQTLSDLVSAMRGRAGAVPLVIERGTQTLTVEVVPVLEPLVTARRGTSLDGALIASIPVEDSSNLRDMPGLFVHSVEPSSAAEMLSLQRLDFLYTVDGRRFSDLDALSAYLGGRPQGQPLRVVFRRWSEYENRWFDYLVREMPGEEIHSVGGKLGLVSASGE